MGGQGRLGDKAQAPLDAHGCPACPHPTLGPAIEGSPDVKCNKLPALRCCDPGIHAACCGPNTWTAFKGSATVFINGRGAYRKGDDSKHCGGMGHLIEGSTNVIIGGPPTVCTQSGGGSGPGGGGPGPGGGGPGPGGGGPGPGGGGGPGPGGGGGPVPGGGGGQPTPVTDDPGGLTVSVVDGSGNAVPGATVDLAGTSQASATADGSGNADFPSLPPGPYDVAASATGFANGTSSATVVANIGSSARVVLTVLTGDLVVEVRTPEALPIAGASVSIAGPASRSGTTDAQGAVTFSGVPVGTYTATATHTDFITGSGSDAVIDGGTTHIGLTLAFKTGDLQVSVVDSFGQAVDAATVTLTGPGPDSRPTPANGRILFSAIRVGSYTIDVAKANYQPGSGTARVVASTSRAVTITLASDVELAVTVDDANTHALISGARVRLTGPTAADRTTGADGVARFTGIAAGDYTILATEAAHGDGTLAQTVNVGSTAASIHLVPLAVALTISNPLVSMKRTFTTAARRTVTMTVNVSAAGTATLTRSDPRVKLFDALTAGTEITFNGTDNVFQISALAGAGKRLFAEGATASGTVDDTSLDLAVPITSVAAQQKLTVVDVQIDICRARTAPANAPAPMPSPDKATVGRFLHAQDPGNQHGRALVIVHPVVPTGITQNVVLAFTNAAGTLVRLFDDPNERPTAGEAAATLSFAPGTIPTTGKRFWLEGAAASAALRDTGVRVGLDGVEPEIDKVTATVVRLHDLVATVTASAANTARFANSPVAAHTLTLGGGAAATATEYSDDFTTNVPLVLMENSTPTPVALAVQVTPNVAGIPITWTAVRETRPAPLGDHANIIALSPRAAPTVTGSALTASLSADAVGSFHVRASIDTNATGAFDDFEPFIVMNLVLVRAIFVRDDSTSDSAGTGQLAVVSGGSVSTRSVPNGFSFTSGTALMHLNCTVDIVGGGATGTVGLNQVFSGWLQDFDAALNIGGAYTNGHRVDWMFGDPNATIPTFHPPPPLPVAVQGIPILDSGRPSRGTGGITATLSSSRITSRDAAGSAGGPPAIGQRLVVEAVDSPSSFAVPLVHPDFAGETLIAYRFNLDFIANLSFWTNRAHVPDATGDPCDRLYVAARRISWTIRGSWTVAAGVVSAPIGGSAPTTIVSSVPISPQAEARSLNIETRGPWGVTMLARNAQT